MVASHAVRYRQGDTSIAKNPEGRYVSKAKAAHAKKVLGPWVKAVAKAKEELYGDKKVPIEKQFPEKGSKLYKMAMAEYKK